jgi:hypothetical protein
MPNMAAGPRPQLKISVAIIGATTWTWPSRRRDDVFRRFHHSVYKGLTENLRAAAPDVSTPVATAERPARDRQRG